MGKYSKTYSNYVLRKRHQLTTDGTIFERDWGTLGERHAIESGKRKIYADSNFLFTDNSLRGTKKRNNTGEWSGAYTQDNLSSTVDNTVNDISLLSNSNDIRDYAYFGSATELIRSSITNIVKWFPARVWASEDGIVREISDGNYAYLDEIVTDGHHSYAAKYINQISVFEGKDTIKMFAINNPFGIDFHSSNLTVKEDDNPMRNMATSWKQYVANGANLTSWVSWSKPYDECDKDYTVLYDITFTYNGNCTSTRSVNDEECCITFKDSTVDCITFASSNDCTYNECISHIYGLKYGSGVIWCTDTQGLVLQPSYTVQEEYFDNLTGFEAVLLSRDTNPKYRATLITPIEKGSNMSGYYYVERDYTWPSIGYCISVDTLGFDNYVSDLYKLGTLMDELWCDNIWRNMTHEAIKNFDWTYTREYVEGDEEDNVEGGTRMQEILRIIGRNFDDIKRYVDGISKKNVITYDGYSNIASAELSDKCELGGWEVYSTKENNDDNIMLTKAYVSTITKLPDRWGGVTDGVSHNSWFDTINADKVCQNGVDNGFMRRLLLNSGGIFASKGTIQGIEEVMAMFGLGANEFGFTERYYSIEPKRCTDIFYHYEPAYGDDITEHTYEDLSSDYSSLDEYLDAIDYNIDINKPYIKIVTDYYMLDDSMTYEEFAIKYNELKNIPFNYDDDDYSGLPLSKVYINNDYYLIPYLSQDKIYDGDIQFESNGGWGKFVSTGDNLKEKGVLQYDYLETLPYMEILQNVSELITVNPYTIKDKRIYYVMDLTDISDFVEVIPQTLSHFFKLTDVDNPQLFASWKNVPTNEYELSEDDYNSYCESSDLSVGVTYDDYKTCQYYDGMVMNNLGNNPHVGYASYDLGQMYYDYMQTPFKYASEHYGFSDLEYCKIVKQFRFDITEYSGDKIVDRTNEDTSEEGTYYLPSKLLIITNKMNMSGDAKNNFVSYFKNVILKYIMQVIPSTTIFILKDF